MRKTNNSLNDPKGRKRGLALHCTKIMIDIITWNKGGFYCLNCLNFLRTKSKLISHEKVCINKDFRGIVMSSEISNILEFNKYVKLDQMPYIIYAEMESLIRNIDGYANNPEKSSTTKLGEDISC